ncbi:alpha/beta hydrolase [Mangrovibacillus cuniculi]|nr:alpha/beta hydrolase-fold protein [Mangrovibacillus cuniculi]
MSYPQGRVEEIEFYSKSLESTISVLLYKPANYSPLYKYHTVIVQDGKDYFQLGRLPRIADELLAEGKMENTLFFAIPYPDVKTREQWYHPDGSLKENYIRFIAHELTPYIDANYPTFQIGNGRMLMGDSLAGTASLMIALQYPHTFGKVAVYSPYVNETVLSKVAEMSQPELLSVYHVIGDQEDDFLAPSGVRKDFLHPNRDLRELMSRKGYQVFYEEFEGSHSWKYWQPDLKRALKMML